MSKEKLVEELTKAWEAGNTKKVLAIIKENPELTKTLELIRKKVKIPFYRKYSDFYLSLVISVPLSFLFVGLDDMLRLDFLSSILFLAFLLMMISTTTGSLVSLRPFEYRSLRLPFWISILTMELSSFTKITLDSYNTYLVTNVTIPFYEYYLKNDVAVIVLVAFLLLFFGGVVIGLGSMYLTKFLIGIPTVDEPYRESIEVTTNFEKFKKILVEVLSTHFLLGTREKKHNQSWFGEFATKVVRKESIEYVAVVEAKELEETLSVRMLFYSKEGLIPKIVRDVYSESLGHEVATSLISKFKAVPSSKVEDFEELHDFALGYTRNKFQEWIDRNWRRLAGKVYIIIVGVVVTSFIIYYLNDIIKYLAPIKEAIIVGSAIATILSWLGFKIYRKKE